jgi:hypothetical protein
VDHRRFLDVLDAGPRAGTLPARTTCSWSGQVVPAEVQMRSGSVLLVIWLIIGAIAAGQRGYYSGSVGSCTKAGTIAVTILAGPLNYMGVNPKVNCTVPQPSK